MEGSAEDPVFCTVYLDTAEYILSNRGKKLIALGGFVYRKQKVKEEKSYWTCVAERNYNCKARIHVLKDDSLDKPVILKEVGLHNHDAEREHVETRLVVNKMKRKALESNDPNSEIIDSVLKEESSPVTIATKNQEKIKATLRRTRRSQKSQVHGDNEGKEENLNVEPTEHQNNGTRPTTRIEVIINELKESSAKRRRTLLDMTPTQVISLQKKLVLITGALSRIGAAISKSLAKAGAIMCLTALGQEKLTALQEEIQCEGGEAHKFLLDVTDREGFVEVVTTIQKQFGPIDVLINNAGVMFYSDMHDAMAHHWDTMIDVNCRGVTNGIACVLPGMVEQRKGCIINMSSDAGKRGFPGIAVYSGTKFFIEGLSQALRQEVENKGVRVICIQPGDCGSEFSEDSDDMNDAENGQKVLDPEDVAKAVLFALTQPHHGGLNEISIEPRDIPTE